jgi:4-hydroxymandelate oxidase
MASAFLLFRSLQWGLSVAGSEGVAHVLEIFKDELDLAMVLNDCACLADIDRSLCTKI